MSSHKIKLTYFAGRGLGEVPRLVLAAAEVPYENLRVTFEEWPELKPKTPFGAMPVLEFDGIVLAQSNTISRFLARKFNLAGKDEVEQAQADMVVDLIGDYYDSVKKIFASEDEEKKKEAVKKCYDEDVPKFLKLAEKLLEQQGGVHFAGGKLTWADISMYDTLFAMTNPTNPLYTKRMPLLNDPRRLTVLKDFPLLAKLIKTVEANPGINKWLKERPGDDVEPF